MGIFFYLLPPNSELVDTLNTSKLIILPNPLTPKFQMPAAEAPNQRTFIPNLIPRFWFLRHQPLNSIYRIHSIDAHAQIDAHPPSSASPWHTKMDEIDDFSSKIDDFSSKIDDVFEVKV